MKLMVLVASIFLMAVHAFAGSGIYEFNCGKSMNVTRTLKVFPKAPGTDGYTLGGEYVTSGPDPVTGMVSAITVNLIGQTDLSSELTGKEIPVFTMLDAQNLFFQVVVAQTDTLGESVPAAEINLKSSDVVEFNCELVSIH